MPDTVVALAFDEAKRAITQQQAVLDNLRSRATTVLSAAAIAVALFHLTDARGDARPVSLGLLGVIALAAGIIQFPYKWQFSNRVYTAINDVDANPEVSVDKYLRGWAVWMQDHWIENDRKITRLVYVYEVACVAFLALVVLGTATAL